MHLRASDGSKAVDVLMPDEAGQLALAAALRLKQVSAPQAQSPTCWWPALLMMAACVLLLLVLLEMVQG